MFLSIELLYPAAFLEQNEAKGQQIIKTKKNELMLIAVGSVKTKIDFLFFYTAPLYTNILNCL